MSPLFYTTDLENEMDVTNMKEYWNPDGLTRSDLIEIIRSIPDSVIVYDSDGRRVICSNRVLKSHVTECETLSNGTPEIRAQILQSNEEMAQAIASVIETGKPLSFILTAPHFIYPVLYTMRPIFDEAGKVKFVIADGRSQAVVNKFSEEYIKLEQDLQANRSSLQLLNQLHLKNFNIVAESPAMQKILKIIHRIAPTDSTITITGESGTGKEVLATAIHESSRRRENTFVPVNCSAVPHDLMESEFFGYAAGAFTGAKATGRIGLFELANNGTIFLDEIGELPLTLQPKLLRVIESGEIRPVGSNQTKKINVRIIAATNRDLKEMVRKNEFREDLFYRLQIIPIRLPPLRERQEDIIPLAQHFLNIYNKKYQRNCYLTDTAKSELLRYHWPGNIRELRNLIERLVIVSETDAILPIQILSHKTSFLSTAAAEPGFSIAEGEAYSDALSKFEKAYIEHMISICGGSVTKAAERMGIHKSVVYRKMKKYKETEPPTGETNA